MPQKIPTRDQDEFLTRERCFITEIVNDAQSPQMSLARCRVLSGVTTELHSLHDVTEVYVIQRGDAEMDNGVDAPFCVTVGDAITIAPGQAQRIRNTGGGDLVFLVICTPRFTAACYYPLEKAAP